MKRLLSLVLSIFLIGCIAWVATATDEYIQVNSMTGATRTQTRYAYTINSGWTVKSNWIAESANRQKLNTDAGWRNLTVISTRLGSISHGCSRAPVSYFLGGIPPEALELEAPTAMDRFVRDFVAADEPTRQKMLRPPFTP